MSTKTKNILITGAAGFIGSHLSKRLEDEGHSLILIDNFSRGKQEYLDYLGVKTKCIKADLKDYINNIYFENVDIVYHFAAKIGGMQHLHGSFERELAAFQENMMIDANVFKSCFKHNVKKIIFTSSVSVYNTSCQYFMTNVVFNENDTKYNGFDPEGGYGWAKAIGEKQLEMLNYCGVKTGIARLFKCYGPCDETSNESNNVVISNCKKVINYSNKPFFVWGDGSATRDFFYVDDCVDAFLKIEKHLDNNQNITVNLGSGKPTSIKKLVNQIAKNSEKKIKVLYDKTKPTGPLSRTANITKARKELGWEPKVNLSDGLKRTYDWVKEWKYQ